MSACQPSAVPTTPAPSQTKEAVVPAATQGIDLASIQPTETPQQPAPSQVDTLRATSTVSVPMRNPAGMIDLPGQEVSALAIDSGFIYWVSTAKPQEIVRAPLASPAAPDPQVVVKSRYLTGSLAGMPIQVRGDWLVFLDQAFNATNPLWRLRAYNLTTHQDKILAEAGGNYLARIYSFSTDGSQTAWIIEDRDPQRACVEESRIVVASLSDGQTTTLDRACVIDDRQWNSLQIAKSGVIASVTRFKDSNKTTVYYWPALDAKPQAISQAFGEDQPSSPALGEDWAAWQASPGKIRLVRLDGSQDRLLASPADGGLLAGPSFSGGILTWLPTPDVLVYRLAAANWQTIAGPTAGDQIGLVASDLTQIAWVRERSDAGQLSSSLEWASIQ